MFEQYQSSPYVRAALDAIAYGEAVNYTETRGGGSFSSFADHPFIAYARDTSDCRPAGRYQFCSFTWARLKARYGFANFSPANQDRGAIALISEAGALSNILAGDWQGAIPKLNRIWPSLPGGSQQNRTLAQSLNYFSNALAVYSGGGSTAQPAPTAGAGSPAPVGTTTTFGPGDAAPVTVYASTDDSGDGSQNGDGSQGGEVAAALLVLVLIYFLS